MRGRIKAEGRVKKGRAVRDATEEYGSERLANDLTQIQRFFSRGAAAQEAVDKITGSRAPLLTPAQAARLIGGGLTGLQVRRQIPGGVHISRRRRAWPVEALEQHTGLHYSDQALEAVGVSPYREAK